MNGHRPRVLLVEDDCGTARLAQRRLQAAGYDVSCAESPSAALKHLQSEAVDLILLDYRLPGESGLDFYQELKGSGYDVPAILMTGFANEQTVIAALRAGMRDFIPKGPEFIDYLPEAVDKVLKQVGVQQRLAGYEQKLAGVISAAADGIISFERDGSITLFNPAAERMFGWRAADALGRSIDMLFPGGTAVLRPAPATAGQARRIELPARRVNGELFQVDASSFEVQFAGDVFTTLIVSDATERRRAEEERTRLFREQAARSEAEAASRAKDIFLATLSHELRTPLTTILGWVRLMRTGQLEPAQHARALETIERNVQFQAALIEDLLDVSRIVSGKLKLDLAQFDLSALGKEVVEAALPQAQGKGLQLEFVAPPSPVHIVADRVRLKQVLSNLLVNAFKFTPSGGRVSVTVERAGDKARAVVADTGKGIAAELLPHIFEPFNQGDRTHNTLGLGLGLSIARHLVEAHGGTVRANSAGPGRGTTFTVEMPALDGSGERRATSASEPRRSKSPAALEGVRVLLVDDDVDARELVRFVLLGRRAEVRCAESVAQALSLLKGFAPDVVVTDIAMPGGDGYQLLEAIRGGQGGVREIPVLAFTAHASEQDRQRAIGAGFRGYISKPIDPFELLDLVLMMHESNRA